MLVSWKVPSIPEGHGGDPAHEGVGRDTLQVEKEAVCQQQQHEAMQSLAMAAGRMPDNSSEPLLPVDPRPHH